MLLKTFKGRILAVSLGMTVLAVAIFGYGLASIYYQHMHKCLSRSLTFLGNMIVHEYDVSRWDDRTQRLVWHDEQLRSVMKGGLIDRMRIEVVETLPSLSDERLFYAVALKDGRHFLISSSTAKIDDELFRMIGSRWIFFLFGFVFTSGVIYLLIRHLFAPFNDLVNHCLTCDDPDSKPDEVSGGREIIALRDAIATLQQRISGLQKAQHESMKALTHELKTPLAQLRLRIDLADQKGEWKSDAIAEAREEIDTIAAKITTILHTTEHVGKTEKIRLKKAINEWVEELRGLWEHRGLRFNLDIPDAAVAELPRIPFERVCRILIENALNHACEGSDVFIRCRGGIIEISNPPCEHSATLIHSSGVGLSIARTLCDYYGWMLRDEQDATSYRVVFSAA